MGIVEIRDASYPVANVAGQRGFVGWIEVTTSPFHMSRRRLRQRITTMAAGAGHWLEDSPNLGPIGVADTAVVNLLWEGHVGPIAGHTAAKV